jgi:recombinational DNA repair ATPase RecF
MNDIAELERRISAALERIGQNIDGLPAGQTAAPIPAPAESDKVQAELQEALEAERSANAQLTERVRAIKEKQENMVSALEKKVARLTQQLDAAGAEAQRQLRLNAELTETNRALSEAARSGITEPHLINKSMLTELEALRAARAAELAEMEEIISELKPLLGEVA